MPRKRPASARAIDTFGVRAVALAAAGVVAAGLFFIALWPDAPSLLAMSASLLLQGAGLGLFMVAYSDMVIAALPQRDRGVAGSLTMLTRTVGIVLGAVWITATLHAAEARHIGIGMPPREAFLAAFHAVFRLAAALAAAALAIAWLRAGLRRGGRRERARDKTL